jgi:hypothetical protein
MAVFKLVYVSLKPLGYFELYLIDDGFYFALAHNMFEECLLSLQYFGSWGWCDVYWMLFDVKYFWG